MNKAMIEKEREKGIRVQHPPDKLPGASASRDVDWGATGHMNKEGALYERERKRARDCVCRAGGAAAMVTTAPPQG